MERKIKNLELKKTVIDTYRYVPIQPRLVAGAESARNEISILIAGRPRAVREEHHKKLFIISRKRDKLNNPA